MFAAIAAAITALQKILGGKHHKAIVIEIITHVIIVILLRHQLSFFRVDEWVGEAKRKKDNK